MDFPKQTNSNTGKDGDYGDGDASFAAKWHHVIVNYLHKPIIAGLVTIARSSALNPKRTIVGIISLAIFVMVTGLFTNFNIDVNEDTLWSPKGSRSLSHYNWIEDHSGLPATPRYFDLSVHAHGSNVLGKEGIERVFKVLDTVRETPGYDDICSYGGAILPDGSSTCRIIAPTTFWNNSVEVFESEIETDEEVTSALSQPFYPDGTHVDHESIMGKPLFDSDALLTSSEIYLIQVQLPGEKNSEDESEDFEEEALDRLLDLQDLWDAESGNNFHVEFFAERSFGDEFTRAIVKDLPLVPIAFIIMSTFTSLAFWKRDAVKSQALLGFGAVATVVLSICSSYGLLFLCGVPFTSMTQILPFIMFGIGLDAAFILTGSFHRTDPKQTIVDRVELMVRDVGVSITLTTLTSTLAFALGCMSSIPAVIWLCQYAFPTILIDFLYQMTFFIAILALDGKRIQDNRRDVCVCLVVEPPKDSDDVEQGDDAQASTNKEGEVSMTDRFMGWYADKLLHPAVRIIVVIAFLGLAAGCAYSASLLTQEFDFTTILPADSYITSFVDARSDHTDRGGAVVDVFFRYEDQSSPTIQTAMEEYINDLVGMEQIDEGPAFFWLRDFHQYVEDHPQLDDKTFYEQFEVFFQDPAYHDMYADSIVLDDQGHITASITTLYMNNINDDLVKDLIGALEDQREVSSQQTVNRGQKNWSFFTYSDMYLMWEFYSVAVEEMILTTIMGIVAVCILSMIFMPHWTAVLFVAPFMCLLYVDLLGVLQFSGVHINSVSYITLVMSIGLLVDFIVHILLRYYEVRGDRVTRTKEMLKTMGSSVLLGGISTFLGVLPLAFTTSIIFQTTFITFLGLVTLGVGHGLILLPVILSIFGPESVSAKEESTQRDSAHN